MKILPRPNTLLTKSICSVVLTRIHTYSVPSRAPKRITASRLKSKMYIIASSWDSHYNHWPRAANLSKTASLAMASASSTLRSSLANQSIKVIFLKRPSCQLSRNVWTRSIKSLPIRLCLNPPEMQTYLSKNLLWSPMRILSRRTSLFSIYAPKRLRLKLFIKTLLRYLHATRSSTKTWT